MPDNMSKMSNNGEEASELKKNLYRIFMQAPMPVAVIIGKDHIYELSNDLNNQVLGIKNPVGKSVKDVVPESSEIVKILDKVFKTGEPFYAREFPLEVKTPKGTGTIYVNATYQPLKDAKGEVIGIMTTGFDVTDQVLAKQKAAESEARIEYLASLIESTRDAVWSRSLNGNIISWNKGAEALYGYKAEEVIGKDPKIIIPRDKKDEFYKSFERASKGESVQVSDTERVGKDGKRVQISVSYSPVKDASGNVISVSVIARDIGERKKVESNLALLSEASKILSSSLDYKKTISNIANIIVPEFADWCSVDLMTEKGLEQVVLKYKEAKMVKTAKQWRKEFPPDLNNTETGIGKILKTGKSQFFPLITWEMIEPLVKHDKKLLKIAKELDLYSAMSVPLFSHKICIGAINFVRTETKSAYTKTDLATAEEIGSRASLAIENARLYLDAQKAVAIRDDFISVASHELKTPITSLKMYTELLERQFKKENLTADLDYVKRIGSQINRLTLLVNDLLNVGRIQSGRLDFKTETFDLNRVTKETVESINTNSHKILIKGNVSKKVKGDSDRISQVLTNLLINAIKYSPESDKIIVKLSPERSLAVVSVQDFGIGIEKEHQNRIFKRFYRVNSQEGRTYPGIGLGLYIANEIVKRHGGELSVVSFKGKGSTFNFTIPYASKR